MAIFNPQKILAPTDFSDESAKVVSDWAQKVYDGGELTVLHVVPLPPPSEADLALGWSLEGVEQRQENIEESLQERFADIRNDNVRFVVRMGSPATEIAKYAEEHGMDLIALPSHGRTGLARLMIGSVAERVVRLAHCPVLVMRH